MKHQQAILHARSVQPEVEKVCQEFFAQTPVRSFCYFEFSPAGKLWFLGSHQVYKELLIEAFSDRVVRRYAPHAYSSGFSLTDLNPEEQMSRVKNGVAYHHLLRRKLGHRCVYTVQEQDAVRGHISICSMHGTLGDAGVNTFYINNTNLIKTFTRYFMQQVADLKSTIKPFDLSTEARGLIQGAFAQSSSQERSLPDFLLSLSVAGKLSKRQREILHWYLKSKTLEETATIMGISVSTARTHLERMRQKLGCRTKAQMVIELLEDGLSLSAL